MTTQQEALAAALAYAMARTPLPSAMETPLMYANRLTPLMVESGYLAAIVPEDAVVVTWDELEALAKAHSIGAISYDGDSWYAHDAGYDYDEANASIEKADAIYARLRAAQEKTP